MDVPMAPHNIFIRQDLHLSWSMKNTPHDPYDKPSSFAHDIPTIWVAIYIYMYIYVYIYICLYIYIHIHHCRSLSLFHAIVFHGVLGVFQFVHGPPVFNERDVENLAVEITIWSIGKSST